MRTAGPRWARARNGSSLEVKPIVLSLATFHAKSEEHALLKHAAIIFSCKNFRFQGCGGRRSGRVGLMGIGFEWAHLASGHGGAGQGIVHSHLNPQFRGFMPTTSKREMTAVVAGMTAGVTKDGERGRAQ